ncbi:MAG TPA: YetF domain-containing protein [Trichocoleus sp.]|jgi:uncharacterized membrane protein YcaP (DUF421 family)
MRDLQVDWASILTRDVPALEIITRGTIVYVALFLILRLVLKRQAGAVGMTDLLVVVLIADAAQNALAGDYHSIPDGILLVSTIIFWSYVLDWLGYHFPKMQRFIHPPPLPLIKNGQVLRHNMRKELITESELMTQIREQGVEDMKNVKLAFMEGDGYISIITTEEQAPVRNERRQDNRG